MTIPNREALVEAVTARFVANVTVSEALRVYTESARIHFERMPDEDFLTVVREQAPDLAELYLNEEITEEE